MRAAVPWRRSWSSVAGALMRAAVAWPAIRRARTIPRARASVAVGGIAALVRAIVTISWRVRGPGAMRAHANSAVAAAQMAPPAAAPRRAPETAASSAARPATVVTAWRTKRPRGA